MHKLSTRAVEKYLRKYFIDHIPVDNLWITQWLRVSGKASELLKSAPDGYDRWAFRPEHWSEALGLRWKKMTNQGRCANKLTH